MSKIFKCKQISNDFFYNFIIGIMLNEYVFLYFLEEQKKTICACEDSDPEIVSCVCRQYLAQVHFEAAFASTLFMKMPRIKMRRTKN